MIQIQGIGNQTGKKFWRSLEELSNSPKFQKWVTQEFPEGATDILDGKPQGVALDINQSRSIEGFADEAIAAYHTLETVARTKGQYDGYVIACFGDPGLYACREIADVPVVGIAESAMLTAWQLGRRYSIVCLTSRLRRWYIECAREHGLDARLASVRALDAHDGVVAEQLFMAWDFTVASAQSLSGRVLEEILGEEGTPALASLADAAVTRAAAPDLARTEERLRAMGYIE